MTISAFENELVQKGMGYQNLSRTATFLPGRAVVGQSPDGLQLFWRNTGIHRPTDCFHLRLPLVPNLRDTKRQERKKEGAYPRGQSIFK